MTTVVTSKAIRPPKQELLRLAAQQQGRQRTEEIHQNVRDAMRTIEQEIAANEGIYPGNKGGLSMNELARRASIHNTTLHGEKYKKLLNEAKAWLQHVKSGAVTGRMRVRKTLETRVSEWRKLYEDLQQSERDTNLTLQQKEAELEAAMVEIEHLRGQVELLRTHLEAKPGKVVLLRSPSQRK